MTTVQNRGKLDTSLSFPPYFKQLKIGITKLFIIVHGSEIFLNPTYAHHSYVQQYFTPYHSKLVQHTNKKM